MLQSGYYYRGCCITEAVALKRGLYYRGGCITQVAVLHRWLYYRGWCITEVAVEQDSHAESSVLAHYCYV